MLCSIIPLESDTVNNSGGVTVSVIASSAVDCGFEPRSGQTKDCKIGICCMQTVASVS